MSIGAIIVNYGTGALILSHLDAIMAELESVPGSKLYVVDNASPNGDAALLEQGLLGIEDAEVIAAPRNGGFSYGNNLGLAAAMPAGHERFFLLNPDAYPLPGCLTTLMAFLDAHPQAGIVGSRLEGRDGSVQRSAFRFMSAASEFESAASTGPFTRLLSHALVAPPPRDEAHKADWLCGASLLIERAVIDEVGLMDEHYFLYFEEVDFQRAAWKAGFEVWYVPEARAVHLVGQSTAVKDGRHETGAPPAYWFDSRRRYLVKNHGAAYAALADTAYSLGKAISGLRGILDGRGAGRETKEIKGMIAARQRVRT